MRKAAGAILAFSMLIPFGVGLARPTTALAAIEYPSPTSDFYVSDYADLISDKYEQIIMDENIALNKESGAQICVLTVDDLSGDSIENYANETFRKWGIGAKDKNNGVLILVSKGDRKDRIEVGYGLEGDLTDAECADILKEGNAYLKYDDWENGIMTIYEAVAKEVYGVYDLEYADGYAQAIAANAKSDTAEDAAEANGEETAAEDEEYDWFDWLFSRVWFQIPMILLALVVYVIRLLGDHGFFIRLLQVVFTIGFVLLELLMLIGDGSISEMVVLAAVIAPIYIVIALFNALIGAFWDGGGGYGGGSSGGDWGSSGGGFFGGGGSSGGGGASGSF